MVVSISKDKLLMLLVNSFSDSMDLSKIKRCTCHRL